MWGKRKLRILQRVVLYLAMLGCTGRVDAQFFGCVDSLRINTGAACATFYQPVCGCNDVTYQNSCAAVNYGGVTTYTDGICEQVYLQVFPNPVTDYLKMYIGSKQESTLFLRIISQMGELRYVRLLTSTLSTYIEVDVSFWSSGWYAVILESEYGRKVFPFIMIRNP